jgi:hypothetical protein
MGRRRVPVTSLRARGPPGGPPAGSDSESPSIMMKLAPRPARGRPGGGLSASVLRVTVFNIEGPARAVFNLKLVFAPPSPWHCGIYLLTHNTRLFKLTVRSQPWQAPGPKLGDPTRAVPRTVTPGPTTADH